jgi:hypothetical protein
MDSELHIVARSSYPIALCGATVTDQFDPERRDTAGRDRCARCLEVAREIRRARGEAT